VHDGQVANTAVFHDPAGLVEGCVDQATGDFRGHDLFDQSFGGVPALGHDLLQNVPFGDDADQTVQVQHQQGADFFLVHAHSRFENGGRGCDGFDVVAL